MSNEPDPELELYRTLAENAGDLICQAGTTARYTYVSPNYEQVLGYRKEDLLGVSIFRHVHADDVGYVHRRFVQGVLSNRRACIEFRYRHKNGSWRWLETSGKPFFGWKGKWQATFISRDVTERRENENAAKQATEVREAGREKARTEIRDLARIVEELKAQQYALRASLEDRAKAEDLLRRHAETVQKLQDFLADEGIPPIS